MYKIIDYSCYIDVYKIIVINDLMINFSKKISDVKQLQYFIIYIRTGD